MNTVTMKNVEFGAGVPKICVPICGKTKEDVLEQAKIILDTPADIIEWSYSFYIIISINNHNITFFILSIPNKVYSFKHFLKYSL